MNWRYKEHASYALYHATICLTNDILDILGIKTTTNLNEMIDLKTDPATDEVSNIIKIPSKRNLNLYSNG